MRRRLRRLIREAVLGAVRGLRVALSALSAPEKPVGTMASVQVWEGVRHD